VKTFFSYYTDNHFNKEKHQTKKSTSNIVMAAIAHNELIKHAMMNGNIGMYISMRRSDSRVPEDEFGEL